MNYEDKNHNFEADGYEIYNSIIKKENIKKLRENLVKILDLYWTKNRPYKSFHINDLDDLIIKFRKIYPKKFGEFYDAVQVSCFATKFGMDEKLLKLASKILKTHQSNLTWTGLLFRMDVPDDNRNVLTWHQDINYMPFNKKGDNSIVLTIPLQNTTKIHGAVRLLSSSHKLGIVKPENITDTGEQRTTQLSITQKKIQDFKEVIPELSEGDVLAMDMRLVHASGFNKSKKVRFSIIIRIYNSSVNDYVQFKRLSK